MRKFVVTKGQDAWVIYKTVVEAESAAAAEEMLSWKVKANEQKWIRDDVREFDHFEIMEGEVVELVEGEEPENLIGLLLTKQEHNTILAALRNWQITLASPVLPNDMIEDIATDGGSHPLLDTEAVDRLCEEINCS